MAHHDSSYQVAPARLKLSAALAFVLVALGVAALGVEVSSSLLSLSTFVIGLALFVAPGILLSRTWCSGSKAVLVGSALGYLLSSLLVSGLYRWGWFGASWIVLTGSLLGTVVLLLVRRRRVRPPLTDTAASGLWLAATCAVVVLLVAVPFSRVGQQTPEGVAYRAYFSADLMTHLSVVGELQKEEFPPQNPFYAGEPLGYYWLFFLFPALAGKWTGNQEALLLTYLAGGILFAGLAYSVARRLAPGPGTAFVAVLAGLAAASFEGFAILARAAWSGEALGSFLNMNVDAFSRWAFELTSLDGLHRSLLYTPQHLFSYSLLLILFLLVLQGEPRRPGTSILSGALLGGMAGASIVTAMLAGPWLVVARITRGGPVRSMVRDLALIGVTSLSCLAWYFALGFFGEAGGALILRRPELAEIAALVVFECGALVLLSLAAWSVPRARPFGLLAGVALLAILFLDIRGHEGVWMAWRAGSVLLISLMLMSAAGMKRWPRPLWVLLLLPASLTAMLDVYNAQDVENRNMSRGDFRWTTVVSNGEIEALHWIRSETVPHAVVQWDTRAREGGEWAMIPALAERRMAVGFPIFLLEREKYRRRERRSVRAIFTSDDPSEAYRLAKEARIDYIFVGRRELEVRGDRVRKLWESPQWFQPAFSNTDVTLFKVLR